MWLSMLLMLVSMLLLIQNVTEMSCLYFCNLNGLKEVKKFLYSELLLILELEKFSKLAGEYRSRLFEAER